MQYEVTKENINFAIQFGLNATELTSSKLVLLFILIIGTEYLMSKCQLIFRILWMMNIIILLYLQIHSLQYYLFPYITLSFSIYVANKNRFVLALKLLS